MKRSVSLVFCAVTLVGVFPTVGAAQNPTGVVAGQNAGGAAPAFLTALAGPVPGHAWVGGAAANNGLGYDQGYFSAGYMNQFWADAWSGAWVVDARGHISQERGRFFGNLGILRTTYLPPMDSDVRVGFWYDWDGDEAEEFGHSFNQLGVSGEVLGPLFDFRVNGYVPIGEQNHRLGNDGPLGCFVGNNILVQHGIDSALEGFDSEIGIHPRIGSVWKTVLDLGGYYYRSDLVEPFGGFRARVTVQPTSLITGIFEVNHDRRFNTTGFLGLQINFGGGTHGQGLSPTGRGFELTKRNAHIVRYHQDPIFAVNPATGQLWNVLHVNNTHTPTPGQFRGTVDNPLPTLKDAERFSLENDMIFVQTGDGTTMGMDLGIILKDGQFLLGQGTPHLVPAVGFGEVLVCPGASGPRPSITNPFGPAVVLANGNTVAGLNFDSPQVGVFGNGIRNADILDNTFSGKFDFGVNIINSRGVFNIARNQVGNPTDVVNAANNQGAQIDGIRIANSVSQFNITDNTIENSAFNGLHLFNSAGFADITGNIFTGNGTAIRLEGNAASRGLLKANIANNLIAGVTLPGPVTVNPNGHGIVVIASGGAIIDLTDPITDNIISANSGDGILLVALDGGIVSALIQNNIIGAETEVLTDVMGVTTVNRLSDGNGLVSGVGIRMLASGGAQSPTSLLLVDVLDNEINGNLGDVDGTARSVFASVTGNAAASLNFVNNAIDALQSTGITPPVVGRAGPGVRFDFDTTNNVVNLVNFEMNTVLFHLGDGLEFNLRGLNGGTTRLGAVLNMNTIASNTGNGIDINAGGDTIAEFQIIRQNFVSPAFDQFGLPVVAGNGLNGLAASILGQGGVVGNGATLILDIQNSVFDQNGSVVAGQGMLLEVGSDEGTVDPAGTLGTMIALVDFSSFQNNNAPVVPIIDAMGNNLRPVAPDFLAVVDMTAVAGSELCLELAGNVSTTQYDLRNFSANAAFNLDFRGDNIPINPLLFGNITAVPPGSCAAAAAPFRQVP